MDYKWHKCKQGEMPEDIASPEIIVHRGLKEEYSAYIGNILCYNPNNDIGNPQYWIGCRTHGYVVQLDSEKVDLLPWIWGCSTPIYWKFIEPINNKKKDETN